MQTSKKTYKLSELTAGLDVTIKGDPDCLITGVCLIQESQPGKIAFLTNSLYRKYLEGNQASAIILSENDAADCPVSAVISRNPHYTYAKIAAFFQEQADAVPGVHASAVIGTNSEIDPAASIGPHCVLGKNVRVGAHAVIGAGCYIGDGAEIGEGAMLDPRVTIYHQVKIGKRSRIASGAVIGSEGFGFANQKGSWHKVAQLGTVDIGDDVDIGANTTIDRGAVGDTVIENGAKLDNLIQVGHNVRIGANTIIAGCVGIAGSTVIGRNCMIGGKTGIAGHLKIADNVMINGGTDVTKSINEPGLYCSGLMGLVTNLEFRKNSARFNRLENLMQKVKTIESAVKTLTERKNT